MPARSDLLKASINAAATIEAVYQFVDRIEAAGGTGSISGIAACHAMIESLKQNRHRIGPVILEPLRAAIEAEKQ